MMLARDRLYQRPQDLVTFLSNHDVARFMSEPDATIEGLLLGFTFQLTARGIPMIYYGDEIALRGGNDPDNRRDFPGGFPGDPQDAFTEAGRTPEQQRVFAHVQTLLRLRAERAELRSGPTEHLLVDPQLFAYRRGRTVVVLNNGTTAATVRLPAAVRTPAVVGGCAAPADGTLVVPARTGCVF